MAPPAAAPRIDVLLPVLTGAVFLGSALILLGWQLDLAVLKAGAIGLRATQPLTAIGLMLAAVALQLSSLRGRRAQGLARIVCALLLAAALFVAFQNALDIDLGTDRLVFATQVVQEQTGPYLRAGRPAGSEVLGFIALTLCLMSARIAVSVGSLGLIGSTIALLAYGLDIAPLYVLGLYAQASLPGSFLFWLAFLAALLIRRDRGCIAMLLGDSIGAISARSMLAWGLCLVIVLIVTVQLSSHAHWYRAELTLLLSTLAGLGIMALGIVAHMKRIDDIEQRRKEMLVQARALHLRAAAATQDAELATKDRQDLVTSLADELRNPLAALSLSTELLKQHPGGSADVVAILELQERQIARLKSVLESRLDD